MRIQDITLGQWLAMAIGMLGVLAAGGTQLDLLVGVTASKAISAACALISAALAVPLSIITGQTSIARQVSNLPGVETIKINANAPPALAALALDPTAQNVDVKPGDAAAVQKIAQKG